MRCAAKHISWHDSTNEAQARRHRSEWYPDPTWEPEERVQNTVVLDRYRKLLLEKHKQRKPLGHATHPPYELEGTLEFLFGFVGICIDAAVMTVSVPKCPLCPLCWLVCIYGHFAVSLFLPVARSEMDE